MKLSALALGLAFFIVVPNLADAQSRRPGESRSTFRRPAMNVHPVGAYGGVQPGVKRSKAYKNRKKVTNKARRKNIVRWVGFQARGDGSRIFAQLTGEVGYEQALDGSDLLVTLSGARLGGRNARRPLDTRFFDTAIRRVVVKRKRRAVVLRISFKNPADAAKASASMEKSDSDGFTYLFLDFGAGTEAATGADDDGDDDDGEIEITDDE